MKIKTFGVSRVISFTHIIMLFVIIIFIFTFLKNTDLSLVVNSKQNFSLSKSEIRPIVKIFQMVQPTLNFGQRSLVDNFVMHHYPKILSQKRRTEANTNSSHRFLVITHLSSGNISKTFNKVPLYTFTFSSMLYASWKYILENYEWAKSTNTGNRVDILVYFSAKMSGEDLPRECLGLKQPSDLLISKSSSCFKRKITEGNFSTYPTLNQFSYLRDVEITEIVSLYDYIIRTDPDVFLSPPFFKWKIPQSVEIYFGLGAYSMNFTSNLLNKIAREDLNWKRQGLENIGSSWVVEQSKFVPLSKKAAFATFFMQENCLNSTKYPEIIPYKDKVPGKGTWPQWWRPVSSMYGGDLAIQDLFDNLTEETNHQKLVLDAHSSSKRTFLEANHIHAFHTGKKFNKFKLYNSIANFCKSGQLVDNYNDTKLLSLMGQFDCKTTIPDYLGNISLHGAVEYFNQNGCFSNFR